MKKVHVFEQAGLGKAPFRCIGFGVETYQACPGAPVQPGTCCDFCGNGIMNVFRVRGADGRVFKVGCDCVAKTGDAGLRREVDELRRAHERKLRQERKTRLEAKLKADAETRCAEVLGRLDRLAASEDKSAAAVARDMAKQLRNGWRANLSANQLAYVDVLEERSAK